MQSFRSCGLSLNTRAVYCINLQGMLDPSWADELGGMQIHHTDQEDQPPVTTLTGELPDQAALAGVLNLVYTLGMPLISVVCLQPVD
ncbi:MAG: hypothetical protein U9R25_04655 [Chloroflexota bacterium]|nr:hypothetical protein [Chloroflexota bacterium]